MEAGGAPADPGEVFLAALAAAPDAAVDTPVLLVVAHPDDEAIALGGAMRRLTRLWAVVVTDGAPLRLDDARAAGFATREGYAQARADELARSLAIGGLGPERTTRLGVPDQEAARRIPEIARALAELVGALRPAVLVTHALEGGHPDHDATALAARCARALARDPPALVEAPFYRAAGAGMATQAFAEDGGAPAVEVPLPPIARAAKRAMLDAHATQARTLAAFRDDVERLRPGRPLDPRIAPNGGALLYERHDRGLDRAGWAAAVDAALAELGLAPWL